MDYAKLLELTTEIGKHLLENGAEIYRVEESAQRILDAYGVDQVESFAVQTAIIVTINTPQTGPMTSLRRIRSRGTNLDLVDQFYTLCRKICGMGERFRVTSFFVTILGGAVTASLALSAAGLGFCHNMDKVVIGVLMNMVPGVAITNSMRDIMAGDLMAGQTKLTEALLTAVAMAAGSGMALTLARWL